MLVTSPEYGFVKSRENAGADAPPAKNTLAGPIRLDPIIFSVLTPAGRLG
jgi:hypothetical protein